METPKDQRKEEEEEPEEEEPVASENQAEAKEEHPARRHSPGTSSVGAEHEGIAQAGVQAFDATRFPNKLHRMLTELDEAVEGDDLAAAISWRPHGRCKYSC